MIVIRRGMEYKQQCQIHKKHLPKIQPMETGGFGPERDRLTNILWDRRLAAHLGMSFRADKKRVLAQKLPYV